MVLRRAFSRRILYKIITGNAKTSAPPAKDPNKSNKGPAAYIMLGSEGNTMAATTSKTTRMQ